MREFFGGERLPTTRQLLFAINERTKIMSTEIDDLKASVGAITTAVSDASNAIKDLALKLTSANSINPADVETAAGTLNQIAAGLEAVVVAAGEPVTTDAPPSPPPPPVALSVTPTSLTGAVGQAFSATLAPAGGLEPYSFSSSLADLSVDATGAVSGTPAAAETGTITVSDSSSPTQSATVSVSIS
jgi:hypothetical protein